MTRTVELKKWGNSLAVRLPKKVLNEAKVSELPTKFDVSVKDNKIILEEQKKPQSLKEIFDGFDYKKYWADWEKEHPNQSKEIDWNQPSGRELF